MMLERGLNGDESGILCANVLNFKMRPCIVLEKGQNFACPSMCHVSATADRIWSQ